LGQFRLASGTAAGVADLFAGDDQTDYRVPLCRFPATGAEESIDTERDTGIWIGAGALAECPECDFESDTGSDGRDLSA